MKLRGYFFISVLAVVFSLVFIGIGFRFFPALFYALVIILATWGFLIKEKRIALAVLFMMILPVAFFAVGTAVLSETRIFAVRAFSVFTAISSVLALVSSGLLIKEK